MQIFISFRTGIIYCIIAITGMSIIYTVFVIGVVTFQWPRPSEGNVISMQKNGEPSNISMQRSIKKLRVEVDELHEKIKSLQNRKKIHGSVKFLTYRNRKRILVTGGAGFVGSHLVDQLMLQGHEVTVIDNLFTGRKDNIEHWVGHPNFELVIGDIVNGVYFEVDEIYHLASPASPPHYMYNPVKTLKTNTIGTVNLLRLAKTVRAKFLLASTSEIYGDPEIHPQKEDYWGHVNPIGPRACYDEGKRVAEATTYAFSKQDKVSVRVARIFNTYGPRMHMDDGRVVSNFILQALQNKPITVYGDGSQTRSFQYIDDLVDGLIRLMNRNYSLPVNLGNPDEHSILDFAKIIRSLVGNTTSSIVNSNAVIDDPQRRRPDISLAKRVLNWSPKVSLQHGLLKTIKYFRDELRHQGMSVEKSSKLSDSNY